MPSKKTAQQAIQEAAEKFAQDLIEAIRGMTLDEIIELAGDKPAPKRRGRPAKAAAPAQPALAPAPAPAPAAAPAAAEAPPAKPKRKKRAWPKCSEAGCDKNVYMPSGPKKLCYQHHLAAGGKPTPLSKVNKAKQAAAAKPKTKVKKAAAKKTAKKASGK